MLPDRSTLVPPARVLGPLGLALLCEVLAWVGLFTQVDGPWMSRPAVLAGVHALTLGTLALAIVGAGWQIVPVITARPWGRDPSLLCNTLVLAGFPLVLLGFVRGEALVAGAALVMLGLGVRSAAVLHHLWTSEARPAARGWIAGAELCLWAGLTLAGALIAGRLGHPVLGDHLQGLRWHAALLGAGWVGGWIGGAGALLLPMFAIGREPSQRALGLAGLLWFGGLGLGQPWLWSAGALVLVGVLLRGLGSGLRLGPALAQAAAGLVALAALALLAPWAPWEWSGGLAIAGFALPVLRGVGQRILPFLAWTHAFGDNPRGAPPVAELFPTRLAWVQLTASLCGAAVLVGGRAAHLPVERAGAALLALGAVLHLVILGLTLSRIGLARSRRGALRGMGVS